jgi:BON domain
MTQASAFQLISSDQKVYPYSSERFPDGLEPGYTAQIDFSQRLEGGTLLRFEFGLIVVKPTSPPESLQPTALTTDAIITASVRSKIAGEAQLSSGNFEIQTDDGVVTIRSKGESLDQAAEVINLALCVPDVRQIVYTMPSAVWKTAGGGKNSDSESRTQETRLAESGSNLFQAKELQAKRYLDLRTLYRSCLLSEF